MTLHHIELQLITMVEIVNILTTPLGTNYNTGAQNLSLSHGFVIYYCTCTMKSSNEVGSKVKLDNSN